MALYHFENHFIDYMGKPIPVVSKEEDPMEDPSEDEDSEEYSN